MLLAAANCTALGLATLGIDFAVCALIVALAAFIGAAVGGFAGAAIGGGIGWITDQLGDFEQRETPSSACARFFSLGAG